MKNIYNFLDGLLLSLSIVGIVGVFFLVNNRFIFNIVDDINYEEEVYKLIVDDLKEYDDTLVYKLNIKDIKKDLKFYMNNGYEYPNLTSKIEAQNSNKEIENIYINRIRFLDKYKFRKVKNIIYIFTLIMVIITGNIFFKNKFKHSIDYVLLISGIINIFIYGYIFLFNKLDGITSIILNKSLKVFLAIASLEVVASIILLNEKRIDKIFKFTSKRK